MGAPLPPCPRETQLRMVRRALAVWVRRQGTDANCLGSLSRLRSGTRVNHGGFLEGAVRFERLAFFFL